MEELEYILILCEKNDDAKFTLDNLSKIEKEIGNILREIKKTNSLTDAEVYFNLLDKAQLFLARLAFKVGMSLPLNLRKFVYDFDRVDDFDQKTYLYSTIKSGGDYFKSTNL